MYTIRLIGVVKLDIKNPTWIKGAPKMWVNQIQVSISPTFYSSLFCTKVLQEAFLYLQFRFELFWWKNIGTNALIKCWWHWPWITFVPLCLRFCIYRVFFLFWLIWHAHNLVIFWAKIMFLDIFHIYIPIIFCKKNFGTIVRLLIFLCCF